jgi:hypothetical protein
MTPSREHPFGAGDRPGPDSATAGNDPEPSSSPAVHAQTFRISATREQFSLLFGSPCDENGTIAVRLARQVILNPVAAKRFGGTLGKFIREYETAFGEIREGGEPVKDVKRPTVALSAEAIAEKAGALFRLKTALGLDGRYEQSFKVSSGELLSNRFLLGAGKAAMGLDAEKKLLEAASLIGMPGPLAEVFRARLGSASCIHFGFEGDAASAVYKMYLEFDLHDPAERAEDACSPRLLYLGFKWDVADPGKRALTRYTWYPWLSPGEITLRIAEMMGGKKDKGIPEAAETLLSLAGSRMPYRHILYLEATEEGNPRRSFDINVYPAQLRVAETYPILSMLCRRQGVPFNTFHALYDTIRASRFGHLAGGMDRTGKPFFTAYYGAVPLGGIEAETDGTRRIGSRAKRILQTEQREPDASRLFSSILRITPVPALERSFKFAKDTVLTDRFLVNIPRDPSKPERDEAIFSLCKEIEMPDDYLRLFLARYKEAKNVLFGYEKGETASIYKAYLEYTSRFQEALKTEPMPESVEIYDGFKWDLSDRARKVHTAYRAISVFSARDIAGRVALSYRGGVDAAVLRIIDDLLDLAGTRTAPGELIYFEASESGNPRQSFDINAYRANLKMEELCPLLLDMARHFAVDSESFNELYRALQWQFFGHLSGGIDRAGKSFLTVYCSEKGGAGRDHAAADRLR